MRRDDRGKVYLIGAGPGDPGLITVKGRKLLDGADCIVYDFLAPGSLIGNTRGAELIYVGKSGGNHSMEQEEIHRILVEKAREGKKVARLKGGDPFIFGRGGEEALELEKEGIPFEVVPGVSSAYAVPAYAGIPVTHRGVASSVSFITGHEDPAKEGSDLDWETLASMHGTLVFLMGVKNLPLIVGQLLKHGRNPGEEVAIIRWGTTAAQVTLTGTLGTIVEASAQRAIKPPAVIVIGKVASLRERLSWFEQKPLFGKTIMVTRTREQASELAGLLAEAGARVIEIPTIQIEDPDSFAPLDHAMEELKSRHYGWVIFTSPNGVERFFTRALALSLDARLLAGASVAAIGPGTAGALKERGILADLVPAVYSAEGIVEAMSAVTGTAILLARAQEARDLLPDSLRARGNTVDIAAVYTTIIPPESRELLEKTLREEPVDLVTFTSSSTVKHFVELMEDKMGPGAIPCACIGPITGATAREMGFKVLAEAREYTIRGLVDVILDWYTERQ